MKIRLLLLVLLVGTAYAQTRELFVKKSAFSTVVVTREGDYHILKFRGPTGDLEESRCDVHRPWLLIHEYLRLQLLAAAFVPHVDDALVVGLGGGTLSNQLARAFPGARVDSLELDPAVVEAARRFFSYREDARHHAYVGDGRAWLASHNDKYDLIFLDAFDGLEIPEPLRTREFYGLVRAHLKSGGAVVTNLHLRSKLYASDRATLGSVFSQSYPFLAIAQTAVVLQNGEPRDQAWIFERSRELRAATGVPYDLPKLAAQRLTPDDWDRSAPVLHDR